MRYCSAGDNILLGKASLGPDVLSRRRQRDLPVPGRGLGSYAARSTFGALTSGGGFGPPVGAGAGAGAEIGASQGAAIGSAIVPGIGTAIGALVGAIGGAIAGSLNKRDPEQANFDQAVLLWQQNPDNIYAIGNKYLALAGLMDLHLKGTPHIPIFIKYNNHGGLGEERFMVDMTTRIYNAAQSGLITQNDTPLTVMAKVVQPWIDSWGYGPMVDPHADMINRLMVGLIMDYVLGRQRSWSSIGGGYPASFNSIPAFALPAASQPQSTASATPSPVAATSTSPTVQSGTVSSIPPALGTPIGYVKDNSTGQMIGIPSGGTFAGLTSTGGWLVSYPAGGPNPPGIYESNNGVLTPYGAGAGLNAPIPAGYKATGQSALLGGQQFPVYQDTAGNSYIWAGGQMIPYSASPSVVGATTTSVPAGGGGGGYYAPESAPATSSTQNISPTLPATGPDMNTWLIAGAVGLGLLALIGARR